MPRTTTGWIPAKVDQRHAKAQLSLELVALLVLFGTVHFAGGPGSPDAYRLQMR